MIKEISNAVQMASKAKDLFNEEDLLAQAGKSAYNWAFDADFDEHVKKAKDLGNYVTDGFNDLSIFAKDVGSYLWRKATGAAKSTVDSLVSEYTRKVLSDEIDYEIADQETLHMLSDGKYKDASGKPKTILGLELRGKIYLDKNVEKNEGLKYRTLLHEAFEKGSDRPDNSNDEEDHVAIELDTLNGLQYAYQTFTGEMKNRAYKALAAFYKTVDAGARAGDDLATNVARRIPRPEMALAGA